MLDCDKLPVDCCSENELNPGMLCITHIKDMGGEETQIYVLNTSLVERRGIYMCENEYEVQVLGLYHSEDPFNYLQYLFSVSLGFPLPLSFIVSVSSQFLISCCLYLRSFVISLQ